MSPALKSIVTAFGPVLKIVIWPLPLIQYCHSSAFGCQCISRMPPGWMVSNAAATVVETVKFLLSAIRTEPPFVSRVGAIDPSEKVNGCGGAPLALTAVRAEPLQRMRQAGGEIPEVAFLHVGDIGPAQFVENGDPARAVSHVGPLGKLVPVHLPDAAGRQPHVDAGDGVRNREGVLRYLTRPAAILNAPWRVVE